MFSNYALSMSKYVDPLTDVGFKKLFGDGADKEIIISFISDLLELKDPLLNIQFLDKDLLPKAKEELIGIYDIYCQDVAGNRFIVEMKKSRLPLVNPTNRTSYYATFPVVEHLKKTGDLLSYFNAAMEVNRITDSKSFIGSKKPARRGRDYNLDAVYCIAVLGYALDGSTNVINRNSSSDVGLPEELVNNKLRFVTIELPLFNKAKPEYSLDNHLNKWLYFFNDLEIFDMKPKLAEDDRVFQKAFQVAEIASLTNEELRAYNFNLKNHWDSYAMLTTAYDEGLKAGMTKGLVKRERFECKIADCLKHLTLKFGSIPPDIEKTIRAIDNEYQIDNISSHIPVIEEWETLKKLLPEQN